MRALKKIKNLFIVSRKERNGMIVLLIVLSASIVLRVVMANRPPSAAGWEAPLMKFTALVGSDTLHMPQVVKYAPRYQKQEERRQSYAHSSRRMEYIGANKGNYNPPSAPPRPRAYSVVQVDLNRADSVELLQLPGIGPYFAGRIVRMRQLLGGFAAAEQLLEINRFPEETYHRILPLLTCSVDSLRLIDFNTIDVESLARHPYLSFIQARALTAWREKHGLFTRPEDLLKCLVIDSLTCERLRPYFAAPKPAE